MKIRTATLQDLAAVTALEAACFPAAEAAPEAAFRARLETYPESFWVMTDEADRPVAMVNGMCTDTPDLHDEMYENATLHDRAGEWQMIFGVATHPEHQKKGYAGQLLQTAIAASRARGKLGLVLTRARTGWCLTTPSSGLQTRACRTRTTAGWLGIRCG